MRASGIPKKTSAQTTWACKVWSDWVLYRSSLPFVDDNEKKYPLVQDFALMEIESMIFWLPKFVLEVRRKDGAQYPPNTLYGICTALNRRLKHADRAEINFFTDSKFISFKETLDARALACFNLLRLRLCLWSMKTCFGEKGF